VTVSKASTNAARYRLVPVGAGSRRRSPEAGSILVISLCSDWLRMQTCLRCWSPWRNSAERRILGYRVSRLRACTECVVISWLRPWLEIHQFGGARNVAVACSCGRPGL